MNETLKKLTAPIRHNPWLCILVTIAIVIVAVNVSCSSKTRPLAPTGTDAAGKPVYTPIDRVQFEQQAAEAAAKIASEAAVLEADRKKLEADYQGNLAALETDYKGKFAALEARVVGHNENAKSDDAKIELGRADLDAKDLRKAQIIASIGQALPDALQGKFDIPTLIKNALLAVGGAATIGTILDNRRKDKVIDVKTTTIETLKNGKA